MFMSKADLLERMDKEIQENAQIQFVDVSWLDEDFGFHSLGFNTADGYTPDTPEAIIFEQQPKPKMECYGLGHSQCDVCNMVVCPYR